MFISFHFVHEIGSLSLALAFPCDLLTQANFSWKIKYYNKIVYDYFYCYLTTVRGVKRERARSDLDS